MPNEHREEAFVPHNRLDEAIEWFESRGIKYEMPSDYHHGYPAFIITGEDALMYKMLEREYLLEFLLGENN